MNSYSESLENLGYADCHPLFKDYLFLLNKWNHAYNLTAIRDVEEMVYRHIADSLAIIPFIKGQQIIDIGTGPGLPGIPLAIALPEKKFTLLDSNGKKIRFLKEVKRVLQLKNVEIIESRVEAYQPAYNFDTIVSRAFSCLEQMVLWTKHIIAENGEWVAMKGQVPNEELKQITYPYEIQSYTVPGTEGDRCCIIIKNTH